MSTPTKCGNIFFFPKKGCAIHKQSITNYSRYTFEIEVRKSESESGTWKIKVYLAPAAALRVQSAFLMLRVAIKFKCRHASHQM